MDGTVRCWGNTDGDGAIAMEWEYDLTKAFCYPERRNSHINTHGQSIALIQGPYITDISTIGFGIDRVWSLILEDTETEKQWTWHLWTTSWLNRAYALSKGEQASTMSDGQETVPTLSSGQQNVATADEEDDAVSIT